MNTQATNIAADTTADTAAAAVPAVAQKSFFDKTKEVVLSRNAAIAGGVTLAVAAGVIAQTKFGMGTKIIDWVGGLFSSGDATPVADAVSAS